MNNFQKKAIENKPSKVCALKSDISLLISSESHFDKARRTKSKLGVQQPKADDIV